MSGTESNQNGQTDTENLDELFDSVYNSAIKGQVVDTKEVEKAPEEAPPAELQETQVVVSEEDKAAETTAANTGTEENDPLRDLPESVRAFLEQKVREAEEAKQREAEWRQRYKSDEGRQAALQRKAQELERLLRDKAQQPTPAQSTKLKVEETEEWKALSESDPVLAKVLRGIAEDASRQAEERTEARVKAATEPLYQERESTRVAFEQQRLLQMVPDLPVIVKDPNYHEWFERQPDSVKQLAASGFADDAFVAIKLFAMDRPDLFPAPQQPQAATPQQTPAPQQVDKLTQERQRKAQSQGVQSKIVTPPAELDEDALFKREYQKLLRQKR